MKLFARYPPWKSLSPPFSVALSPLFSLLGRDTGDVCKSRGETISTAYLCRRRTIARWHDKKYGAEMMRNKSSGKVRFYAVILMLRDTRRGPYKSEIYCFMREMRFLFATARERIADEFLSEPSPKTLITVGGNHRGATAPSSPP